MRIGIDARKIGDYGIGTYIRGLLSGLAEIAEDEEYVVFAPSDARSLIPFGERRELSAPHYSVRELIVVGRAIAAASIDVFHAPHYVVPLTRCPTVVTIHDLIHLHQRQRNPLAPIYARSMIARAVRKGACILTVTEVVRRQIIETFSANEASVIVTPNGVAGRFSPDGPRREGKYFLFVGNEKPHKNIAALAAAFAGVRSIDGDVRLLLVGGKFESMGEMDGVEGAGFVDDDELPAVYRGAIALVMPSIEEGFGLPALEAMACGTPVITSNDPALIEVTADAALHGSANEMGTLMLRVMNDHAMREHLRQRGIARAREFTWRRCAELTRAAYFSAKQKAENRKQK